MPTAIPTPHQLVTLGERRYNLPNGVRIGTGNALMWRFSVAVTRWSRSTGAPAGFQARVGKIRRKAPKKIFRLPTLVFNLPTLPYVTVALPAHRTEADLREKASLATNQEGPLPSPPSPPSDLALQLGLVIHTPGL